MNNNFDVSGFMQMLETNKAMPRSNGDYKSLEKIYLSYARNYGKYQISPMNSVVTGYPFVPLTKTRQIHMPRHNVLNDGTIKDQEPWMHILPKEAYVMRDGGRLVSSLTAEDEKILNEATTLFDKLYDELGGNEKDKDKNKTINFMRRRNYTIWMGYCLNKWSIKNTREPEKKDFSGLFVCTAKDFLTEIDNNISNLRITHGSDDWTREVYNRDLTGRTGCLIFSISLNEGGSKIGYNISIQHVDGVQNLSSYVIPEDEARLMSDPVEAFLGWQADKKIPGRLFNATLMKELIEYMSAQLRAVQLAKQNGTDLAAAIQKTSETALQSQAAAKATVDPVLKQQQPAQGPTPEEIYSKNTNPYVNPPAAQIDPISQTPVNPQQYGSGQPQQANPGQFGGAPNPNFAPPTGWGVAGNNNTGWPQSAPQQPQANPFANPYNPFAAPKQ